MDFSTTINVREIRSSIYVFEGKRLCYKNSVSDKEQQKIFQMCEVSNRGPLQSLYILICREKLSESLQVTFSDFNATKLKITNKRTKS